MAKLKRILRPVLYPLARHPNRFLKNVSGVVHVGANAAGEREVYRDFGLNVIYIEPIPKVFQKLEKKLADFPKMHAVQALITDVDGKEYQFNVASNHGQSSSIFELGQHEEVWPNITFEKTIPLKSMTLPSMFERVNFNPSDYQALIMDTQGSELLVLQGSISILKNFKYIKTEAADFEIYQGCCQLYEIDAFMKTHGYREFSRKKFASKSGVGNCFDIVYERED